MPDFSKALAEEYNQLFALAKIRPQHLFEVDAVVARIFKPENMAQYQKVEARTGVPAHVVGIIHNLEASSNFKCHMHNGDPLTARTVQVPAGRPKDGQPPFDWFVSAIDALTMKGHELDQWTDWSIAGIAFVLEKYNGFGYRNHHPNVKSPYLWSFTTIYAAGKYVADGTWSDTAVSKQCGGMAALLRMIETGRIGTARPQVPADPGEVAPRPIVPAAEGAAAPLAAPPRYPGHVLRNGSSGDDVKTLQLRLHAFGITDTGGIDGDFGDRTEAAVRLFQARSVDDSGEPLEIDGVVGPQTWTALFGAVVPPPPAAAPAAGTLLAEVLRVAAAEVGVREVPPGSNRGPRVDEFLSSVDGGLLGQPWCMAFVYWCFARAAATLGVPNPAPRTAGVKLSWNRAQALPGVAIVRAADAVADTSLVRPGMVFYISTGDTTGHTGFVADVVGGVLVTIEGNTNEGGSSNGIGVFQRNKRKIKDINIGFIAFG